MNSKLEKYEMLMDELYDADHEDNVMFNGKVPVKDEDELVESTQQEIENGDATTLKVRPEITFEELMEFMAVKQ